MRDYKNQTDYAEIGVEFDENGDIWIRPQKMWNEKIDNNTLRFTLVENT